MYKRETDKKYKNQSFCKNQDKISGTLQNVVMAAEMKSLHNLLQSTKKSQKKISTNMFFRGKDLFSRFGFL